MFAAGIFVLFVALLAWAGFGVQKYKAGRLAKTPLVDTGEAAEKGEEVAGDKGAIPYRASSPTTSSDLAGDRARSVCTTSSTSTPSGNRGE